MEKKEDIALKRQAFIRKAENVNTYYDINPKPLASGSYGAVHLCTQKDTKEERAIKIIPKYKLNNLENFLNEIELLRMVDHPQIIRMYEWFEDKVNIYIIMDLCKGGELFDKISSVGHFTEQVAAELFKNMMTSVNYCYDRKICHKDLKPENFMFHDKEDLNSIKLIDFGLSQIFEDPKIGKIKMKAKVGTPYYIAPEIIKGNYDEKCDIWSMGVILYILICGAPPFYGANDLAILESVKKGKFEFDLPIWKHISKECMDLISKMLTPPEKRPNAQQVLDDPWFKKFAGKKETFELPKIVTQNLNKFKTAEKVKKAVLTYLATQLSEKEMEPFKKVFVALDKNGDGKLSMEEIETGLKGKENLKELKELMQSMDVDKSGFIDYNEFLAAAIGEEVYLNKGKLKQAFNMFDKDRSGKIDSTELKSVIGGELSGIDEKVWNQMIKDADVNGDGQIDFDEFFKMMYTLKLK